MDIDNYGKKHYSSSLQKQTQQTAVAKLSKSQSQIVTSQIILL